MGQQRETDRRAIETLAREVSNCRVCVDQPDGVPLPHEPRPVLRISNTARLCISGQAPGTRVHASGVPFTDPSGDRLRQWLDIDADTFYDRRLVAIVPMGFCFPGLDERGSDLPPRRECARHWHDRIYNTLGRLSLILAIGTYAQAYHLGMRAKQGVTATVRDWRAIASDTSLNGTKVFPLPHPSWRNSGWLKRNPWFEAELLPVLRAEIQKALG